MTCSANCNNGANIVNNIFFQRNYMRKIVDLMQIYAL